jgi:hypothetical protein
MPKITFEGDADYIFAVLEAVEAIPPSREQIEGVLVAEKKTRGRKKAEAPPPAPVPAAFAAPGAPSPGLPEATQQPTFASQAPPASPQLPNFQDAFAQPFGGAPNPNAAAPAAVQDPSHEVATARAALINLGNRKVGGDMDRVAQWAAKGLGLNCNTGAELFGTGPGTGLIVSVPPALLAQITDVADKS